MFYFRLNLKLLAHCSEEFHTLIHQPCMTTGTQQCNKCDTIG
uniref:Uncharacterized protein n=1 Tax=Rhizophora mucronata TaxID=61149 RepID=A0A2P2R1L4_RHIMU